MHASKFILEDSEFIDLAKFFEHWTEIFFFEMSRNLSDEELDGI